MVHKYVRSYSILMSLKTKCFFTNIAGKQTDISSRVLSLSYLARTEMVVADIEKNLPIFSCVGLMSA